MSMNFFMRHIRALADRDFLDPAIIGSRLLRELVVIVVTRIFGRYLFGGLGIATTFSRREKGVEYAVFTPISKRPDKEHMQERIMPLVKSQSILSHIFVITSSSAYLRKVPPRSLNLFTTNYIYKHNFSPYLPMSQKNQP